MTFDPSGPAIGFGRSRSDAAPRRDLICFSHLRWDFVFQRPQQLMVRFGETVDIHFWEEPIRQDAIQHPSLVVRALAGGIKIITPSLPAAFGDAAAEAALRDLLNGYTGSLKNPPIRWYYTPMMLPFSRHIASVCTVYDCMDELANFKFAPPALAELEAELFRRADLVFTGGYSLYEAKRHKHPSVHPFPSSVDQTHFAKAIGGHFEPVDQAGLSYPRLGFFGVVDERMDLELLGAIAESRPQWTIVVVGPVVKIDPATLPAHRNIHYLGPKTYDELPVYAAGWDVALMPFALNESTRFISPTKTPEYLSAGLPVVSTPIVDVIRHYGHLGAVKIAAGVEAFLGACESALALDDSAAAWREPVRATLADLSWDKVAAGMMSLMDATVPGHSHCPKPHFDYLVVGAGFAGSVMAERLAADAGKRVLIIDRRPHVGGNAYDHYDDAGILIHRYGPHIFHTNSDEIAAYLSRFTEWRAYEHRVLAQVGEKRVPMPINRTTLNMLYGLSLTGDGEVAAFLAARAEPVDFVRTSADVVISKIGRELYETFFQGYTRKQWGLDPADLDKTVTARVPTRSNDDDRYFTDSFQAMPAGGYTAMFAKMLAHPNIEIEVGVEFEDIKQQVTFDRLVFTGPIDEYFGHCYGKLPYRSLDFRHETIDRQWFQPVAVVNFPDETVAHTRITEYKHLTGQIAGNTSISYEFPKAEGDPYYPIPRPENRELFKRYEALALTEPDVEFVGRLATYQYYNMDQVVGQALATYRRLKRDLSERTASPHADPTLVPAE